MATLYEITGDYLRILEMMKDSDFDDQCILDTLEAIDGELEVKAENYVKIIKELESEAEKFKKERDRLNNTLTIIENRYKNLKQRLFDSMKLTGKTKILTDIFCICIQKNGGKKPLTILPDADIPDEYCEKVPDLEKIRKSLESGNILSFAELKERGEHLRIK